MLFIYCILATVKLSYLLYNDWFIIVYTSRSKYCPTNRKELPLQIIIIVVQKTSQTNKTLNSLSGKQTTALKHVLYMYGYKSPQFLLSDHIIFIFYNSNLQYMQLWVFYGENYKILKYTIECESWLGFMWSDQRAYIIHI